MYTSTKRCLLYTKHYKEYCLTGYSIYAKCNQIVHYEPFTCIFAIVKEAKWRHFEEVGISQQGKGLLPSSFIFHQDLKVGGVT